MYTHTENTIYVHVYMKIRYKVVTHKNENLLLLAFDFEVKYDFKIMKI